jgi:hypothetical protein
MLPLLKIPCLLFEDMSGKVIIHLLQPFWMYEDQTLEFSSTQSQVSNYYFMHFPEDSMNQTLK